MRLSVLVFKSTPQALLRPYGPQIEMGRGGTERLTLGEGGLGCRYDCTACATAPPLLSSSAPLPAHTTSRDGFVRSHLHCSVHPAADEHFPWMMLAGGKLSPASPVAKFPLYCSSFVLPLTSMPVSCTGGCFGGYCIVINSKLKTTCKSLAQYKDMMRF